MHSRAAYIPDVCISSPPSAAANDYPNIMRFPLSGRARKESQDLVCLQGHCPCRLGDISASSLSLKALSRARL